MLNYSLTHIAQLNDKTNLRSYEYFDPLNIDRNRNTAHCYQILQVESIFIQQCTIVILEQHIKCLKINLFLVMAPRCIDLNVEKINIRLTSFLVLLILIILFFKFYLKLAQ